MKNFTETLKEEIEKQFDTTNYSINENKVEVIIDGKEYQIQLSSVSENILENFKNYDGFYAVTKINNDGFSYVVDEQLTTIQVEEAF